MDPKNQADSLAYQVENLSIKCFTICRARVQDKSKRELVDLKNQADSLAYQSEKQLKDAPADKLPADVKSKVGSGQMLRADCGKYLCLHRVF